jgi:hypothetical protein
MGAAVDPQEARTMARASRDAQTTSHVEGTPFGRASARAVPAKHSRENLLSPRATGRCSSDRCDAGPDSAKGKREEGRGKGFKNAKSTMP